MGIGCRCLTVVAAGKVGDAAAKLEKAAEELVETGREWVYGSAARRGPRVGCDIDLAAVFPRGCTLWRAVLSAVSSDGRQVMVASEGEPEVGQAVE